MAENPELLRNRFLDRLLALAPESVLDLGCGVGEILTALARAGVRATGIDSDPNRVSALCDQGLDARLGTAEQPEVAPRSHDWVIIRHVLHHLEQPGRALAAAWGIARCGLLISEPWYDPTLPSHELAQRVNLWVLAQDRRLGKIHNPPLSARDIIDLLPAGEEYQIDCEHFLRLHDRPIDRFVAESRQALASLGEDDPQRREYRSLLAEVEAEGHAWNGTLVVKVTKPA